jgi:hypothetical protein
MTIDAQRRSLLRHGVTFLFLGLWLGIATAVLPNARGWMAAHLTAFFTGLMLSVLAFAWRELRLTDGQRRTAYFLGVLAGYVGLAAGAFGAIADLPGPASAPGVPMPQTQGLIFFTLLAVIIPSLLVSFGLVLCGTRGE